MIGETIGHYRITAKLGEGGMGAVYRATDTKLNREVAIKVLPDTFAADPDRLARFTREAQVLASLNHPNIATIFGVEDKALVMELIEGNDLAGPLPLTEALQIARQIAEGLEAAHDKGIIHRDLKPANIKVTPNGVVKVLDFGLAKATDSAATPTSSDSPTMTLRATQAGLIMGTAGYMSPEQAAGKTVDKRADIWAFGVVLHELLTGKKLFHGETVSHTLASVLKDPIDFAILQAPAAIQALLQRCLDRNLKQRLKDIGEARIAIENFLANPKPQVPAKPTTHPTLWIALAGASMLLAITITTLWLRTPPAQVRATHFNVGENYSAITVSPDGKWLVSAKEGLIHARRLDNANWIGLKGTEGYETNSAFWSEDSTTIGFVSAGRLRILSLDGSAPRELMEVQDFDGASWRGGRSEGTILVATNAKLKSFDLRSATIRDIPLAFKAGASPSQPVFLPQGDGFVFLLDHGEGMRLYRSALGSSSIDPLLHTHLKVHFAKHPYTGKWHVFYIDGEREQQNARILLTAPVDPKTGTLLSDPAKLLQGLGRNETSAQFSAGNGGVLAWAYTSAALPVWHIKWTDRNGTLLSRIAENRSILALALSPDESKIAAQVHEPEAHIWIFDAKTGAGSRISNTPGVEMYPSWAPDSKSIFYLSLPPNTREIRRHFLDTATRQESLWQETGSNDSQTNLVVVGVSADGRHILTQNRSSKLNLLDLQAPTPRKLEPMISSESYSAQLTLSPDAHSLATPTGTDGLMLQAFPLTADPPKRFKRGNERFRYPFFTTDGRTLYAESKGHLVAFPISPDRSIGEPKLLFPWQAPDRFAGHTGAASRDGNRILIIDTDEREKFTPQVLTDWTTLLPK